MATSSQQPNSSDPPTEKTIYWAETIVRWTRDACANVYVEPTDETDEVIAEIHRGDMVQVRTDLKRGTWVPCRAGHVTGWMDTRNVKLIRTGTAPLSQTITIEMPKIPDDAEQRKRKTSIIQRLIKFFK